MKFTKVLFCLFCFCNVSAFAEPINHPKIKAAENLPVESVHDDTHDDAPSEVHGEVPSAPNPARWYLGGNLGMAGSHGADYLANNLGLGLGINGGVMVIPRLSLGLFYKAKVGIGVDLGLLGGGGYSSDVYGAEINFAFFHTSANEIRIGIEGGRFIGSGVQSILWIPYSTTDVKAWGVGPTLSYLHFLGEKRAFGLGVETSYFRIFSPQVDFHSLTGRHSSAEAQDFGIFDFSFSLQWRF